MQSKTTRTYQGLGIETDITLTEDDPELIWLAGLLEGEGCFQCDPPNITLQMTDRDVVERAMRIGQSGNFMGPIPRKNPKHKDIYRWRVSSAGDVLILGLLLLPHMGTRRSEAIRKMICTAKNVRTALSKHGTRAQYKRGCRCDPCRSACYAYQQDHTTRILARQESPHI
jgi:hypothetical protein